MASRRQPTLTPRVATKGLPVPIRFQQGSHDCVPTCLAMVIDYLNGNRLDDPIRIDDVGELVEIVKTDSEGTDMDNVRPLNEDKRVLAAIPSVEFDAKKVQRDMLDIIEDLGPKKRLPSIAWMVLGEGYDETCHAVVITQILREGVEPDEITYIDPWDGQKTENLVDFSHKWEKADRWAIRIIFGKRESKRMEEFTEA